MKPETKASGGNLEDMRQSGTSCPLPKSQQTRNLVIYGINVSLIYLAAPVLYVGITQAALCDELGAGPTIANLPTSVYFWMTPLPIAVAWYFSSIRHLKPVLIGTYLITAVMGLVVTATLIVPTPGWAAQMLEAVNRLVPEKISFPLHWVIPAMLMHAGVLGCSLGVVATYQWEVLGRGVADERRGQAFAFAFGFGPVLAFLSSMASQWVLKANPYPVNFQILFASTAPIMGLAAILSSKFVVPRPLAEIPRVSFHEGIFGGFGQFLGYRLLFITALGMILVTCGYNILNNIALFTKEALGEQASQYAGIQNGLRFGFKALTGLVLGWILTKSNPKAGLLITTGFCLASVVWPLFVTGQWFLFSFALMGAGELFGVYYPNYILCCSPKSKMRRNMAFTSMLNMPSGFVSVFYGLIAQYYSMRASFLTAIVILVLTLLLVEIGLPGRPCPRDLDMDESDRAPVLTPTSAELEPAT